MGLCLPEPKESTHALALSLSLALAAAAAAAAAERPPPPLPLLLLLCCHSEASNNDNSYNYGYNDNNRAALDFASLVLPVPAEGYLSRVWSTKVRSQDWRGYGGRGKWVVAITTQEEGKSLKEHGFGSCFLLLDALFGATALPLFVRGNALAFWYKLRSRSIDGDQNGTK
ncbi:hypothetical protein OPV22_026661 [Ensete ventricosum]|uniref:Uncharacterized protein n=1 Tax=Ensete ventricosum TaxID=4639 RepID=A0AAV8Q5C3_ENSVE|nr:hypothetical protein OPV22_026661 [Ensete ventricosum]